MIKIMKAVDYMKKELKHAYMFLEYAVEAKTESPELWEIYMKIAECES
jgi:nitrate/nitrite-specific signal transduction histidine kinase